MRNKRRILKVTSILAAAFLLAGSLPEEFALTAPVKAYAAESVITVSSEADLITLSLNCYDEAWSVGKTVKLSEDITLDGNGFTCIPIFNGTFDGQGHSIRTYRYAGDGFITGFFREVGATGTVRNLNLDVSLSTGDNAQCTGAIAGVNAGLIEKCGVYGNVSGSRETGGIVGINQAGGNIKNCTNEAKITGFYYTGGIAGKNYGTIENCVNHGNVNDSTGWVEMDDEHSGDILGTLTEEKKIISIHSGVDTGGITGFSDGTVKGCKNTAIIGYEHVGYNVGGVVGRHGGTIYNCTNQGTVYGKKDVGGIVGQQEPYIELNQAKSISRAVERLAANVDSMVADAGEESEILRAGLTELQDDARAARATAGTMSDKAQNYIDSSTKDINSGLDSADAARKSSEAYLKSIYEKDQVKEASEALAKLQEKAATEGEEAVRAELERAEANLDAEVAKASKEASAQLDEADKNAQKASNQIRGAANDWQKDSSTLNAQLDAVSASLTVLEDNAGEASDIMLADITSVNDQIKSTYGLISDLLNGVQEEGVDYLFADVSEDAMGFDVTCKTLYSYNRGVVKGDIDVGGIAGNLAVDDENLESNRIVTLGLKTGESYTVSGVIGNCYNYGFATSKNDCAGGIAGRIDKGVIYGSYGYGSAESTAGGYVGGIVGRSEGLVLSSYALCSLSGSNNVGGIAGSGTAIRKCVAMPIITHCEGNKGAIVGETVRDELTKEADLSKIRDNYYVSEDLHGIDDIDYSGAVTAYSYEELIKLPDLPLSFRHLRVSFRAGDAYLGSKEMKYGESLKDLSFPTAPGIAGHYAYWPDMTGETMKRNIVIEASYAPNITVLKSEETFGDTGKATAYIEGQFTVEDSIKAELRTVEIDLANVIPEIKAAENISIVHINVSESEDTAAKYADGSRDYKLRLYNPYEHVRIWQIPGDVSEMGGSVNMTELEVETRGEYLNLALNAKEATFMIAEVPNPIWKKVIIGACIVLSVVILVAIVRLLIKLHRKAGERRALKKKKNQEKAEKDLQTSEKE
ncbi:MAG: hypothetical protein K6E19_06640 [Lachnospiraceae bacterium]|nr:hypothetical protein [Lachnospiraceae bacterium]